MRAVNCNHAETNCALGIRAAGDTHSISVQYNIYCPDKSTNTNTVDIYLELELS